MGRKDGHADGHGRPQDPPAIDTLEDVGFYDQDREERAPFTPSPGNTRRPFGYLDERISTLEDRRDDGLDGPTFMLGVIGIYLIAATLIVIAVLVVT